MINEQIELRFKNELMGYIKKNVTFEGSPSMIESRQLAYVVDIYNMAVKHLVGVQNDDNLPTSNML